MYVYIYGNSPLFTQSKPIIRSLYVEVMLNFQAKYYSQSCYLNARGRLFFQKEENPIFQEMFSHDENSFPEVNLLRREMGLLVLKKSK